jgi:hypothetical protein
MEYFRQESSSADRLDSSRSKPLPQTRLEVSSPYRGLLTFAEHVNSHFRPFAVPVKFQLAGASAVVTDIVWPG